MFWFFVDFEMSSENKVGLLEEESLKRKERLKHLKEIKKNDQSAQKDGSFPKPSFRSYKPQDATINDYSIAQEPVEDMETVIKDQLELIKTPVVIEEIDIASLAPRKPDWDLKRDVSKKLEKLEKRTQKAIAELIRERLRENQDISETVDISTLMIDKRINTNDK